MRHLKEADDDDDDDDDEAHLAQFIHVDGASPNIQPKILIVGVARFNFSHSWLYLLLFGETDSLWLFSYFEKLYFQDIPTILSLFCEVPQKLATYFTLIDEK